MHGLLWGAFDKDELKHHFPMTIVLRDTICLRMNEIHDLFAASMTGSCYIPVTQYKLLRLEHLEATGTLGTVNLG